MSRPTSIVLDSFKVKSCDGWVFEVTMDAAKMSRLLFTFADLLEPASLQSMPVKIVDVKVRTLRLALKWIEHHKHDEERAAKLRAEKAHERSRLVNRMMRALQSCILFCCVELPEEKDEEEATLSEWDDKLLDISPKALLDLRRAAMDMHIDGLVQMVNIKCDRDYKGLLEAEAAKPPVITTPVFEKCRGYSTEKREPKPEDEEKEYVSGCELPESISNLSELTKKMTD